MLGSRRRYARSSDRPPFPQTASSAHGQRWRSLGSSPVGSRRASPASLRSAGWGRRPGGARWPGSPAGAGGLLAGAVPPAPADASVWNDLGVVLVRRGQHPRGIEAIQRSLALDSQNAEAHRNLAVALEQDGQTLGAAAHYRAFLALAPGHPDRAQIEQRLRSPGPAESRR